MEELVASLFEGMSAMVDVVLQTHLQPDGSALVPKHTVDLWARASASGYHAQPPQVQASAARMADLMLGLMTRIKTES